MVAATCARTVAPARSGWDVASALPCHDPQGWYCVPGVGRKPLPSVQSALLPLLQSRPPHPQTGRGTCRSVCRTAAPCLETPASPACVPKLDKAGRPLHGSDIWLSWLVRPGVQCRRRAGPARRPGHAARHHRGDPRRDFGAGAQARDYPPCRTRPEGESEKTTRHERPAVRTGRRSYIQGLTAGRVRNVRHLPLSGSGRVRAMQPLRA